MLNQKEISKLSDDQICEYLKKPRRIYDEDILHLAEGVRRVLARECCEAPKEIKPTKKKKTEEE